MFAFSVLPAMSALALTARIGLVFVLATSMGVFSGVGGYGFAFRADLPVGATQAATASALFAVALLWRFASPPARARSSTTSAPRTDAA